VEITHCQHLRSSTHHILSRETSKEHTRVDCSTDSTCSDRVQTPAFHNFKLPRSMLRSNSARKRHLLVHSRDTRRLLFLTLLVSAAACARAFSLFQSSFRAARCHVSPSVHPAKTPSATALFVAPQNPEPDEDEWRALLAAFQMYKAAYGDLKVPSRFIVPGMPPWPGKNTLPRHDCHSF
jgi:hypothetical protein